MHVQVPDHLTEDLMMKIPLNLYVLYLSQMQPIILVRRFQSNLMNLSKLENASEKVIISPPQKESPEVKTSGKRVLVEFFDTLQENTTYTIDFGDAIVDNNEGNPLGQFSYAFSTGDRLIPCKYRVLY